MKVVHVNAEAQRNACLARLCAEVYGQEAGLTPLVVFTGTCSVLFPQEAARLFAAVDGPVSYTHLTLPTDREV